VACLAVQAIGRPMAGKGRRAERAAGSLAGVGAVVAGVAARAAYRSMVHRVGREAGGGIAVAAVALGRSARDVRRRGHADGVGVVVAGRTATGYAGMVHLRPGAEACRGPVAGLAGQGGREMILRFTARDLAVVAGRAGSLRLRVVDGADIGPKRCLMAAVASRRGLWMVDRLAGGHCAVVAGRALRGCRLETAADVTGLARSGAMAACEGVSGLEVIERCLRMRGMDRGKRERARNRCAPNQGAKPAHQEHQPAAVLAQRSSLTRVHLSDAASSLDSSGSRV
jgi:hypothetical protein